MFDVLCIVPDCNRVIGGAAIHADRFLCYLKNSEIRYRVKYTYNQKKFGRIVDAIRTILLLFISQERIIYMHLGDNKIANIRDALFVLLVALLRKRVVFHSHSGKNPDCYITPLYKSLVNLCKNVTLVTLCQTLKQQFEQVSLNGLIFSVNNGIAVDKHSLDEDTLNNSGPVKCIFVGEFGLGKGEIILENVASQTDDLDYSFEFIGGIKDVGNSNNIKMLGRVSNKIVIERLNNADIFVFPTQYVTEGFPLVILEAMACGCAIISTNYRCIPDIVSSQNGFLVENSDQDSMSKEILHYLEIYKTNPKILMLHKQRSIDIVAKNFSETTSFEKLTDILNEQKKFL